MLRFQLFVLLIAYIFVTSKQVVGHIRPSASIHTNESFFAYLDYTGEVESCWFEIRNTKKQQVYLNSTTPIKLIDGFKILPFSTTTCGVYGNVSTVYNDAVLKLEAHYTNGVHEVGEIRLYTEAPLPKVIRSNYGETITISCSLLNNLNQYCYINDNNGASVDSCEFTTTIKSNRTFSCDVRDYYTGTQVREDIIVTVNAPTEPTNGTVEETATSIILRCEFNTEKMPSCVAELPYEESVFYIKDEQCNGRYSAYDTNIMKSKCAIEIPKPLRENEIGVWRIVNYGSEIQTGCHFYVGQNKSEIIKKALELEKTVQVINVHQQESDETQILPTIENKLPFSVGDCFMLDPNNVVHFSNPFNQMQKSYGKCIFSQLPAVNGTWKFYAFAADGAAKFERIVEVNVKSRDGEVLTNAMAARKGESVKFMCRSAFGEPITYCLFVNPENDVFLMATANETKTDGRVQYDGRGLAHGDCGIELHDVLINDFGTWQCLFHVTSNKYSSKFELELIEKYN